MLETQLRRIYAELLGDLVEVDLEREARLRRPVAPFRSTRRLVRKSSSALKLVTGNVISDGLQRSRVVRARDAVGPVAAAVEQRLEVHAGNGAVLFHPRLHPHEGGVAPAVAIEDLFAREGDFHRPPGDHRELGGGDLVAEGIALSAEAAPVGTGDHPDARRRELEHLGERPVHVVWCLRSAPQRELPVRRGGPVGHRRVLLHRQVGVPLEEEHVLADDVGLRQPRFDVAELEIDQLVDVAGVGVVVDRRLGMLESVERIGEGTQHLVFDGDQVQRLGGRFFGGGRDGGQRVAHEAHLVERQGVLVLAHRKDAERDREILPRQHGFHALHLRGPGRVDREDARVRVGAPEQLGEEHPRQEQIVGEPRHARDFRGRVHLAVGLPDHPEPRRLLTGRHTGSPVPASRPRRACEPRPARRLRRS